MEKTLYEWDRARNIRLYDVKDEKFPLEFDENPCSTCVVRGCRSPEHCDPCRANPDRERLKKAGLL